MNPPLLSALALTAAVVGSTHTLAPDHWVPFAALARAQRWSVRRTFWVTVLCGFGHVTVSALLGLLGLLFGLEMVAAFGARMEAAAGVLLVAFGIVYAVWGLRRALGKRVHGHAHHHYDHVHEPARATVGGLFVLFSADPCVAVVPILFAAAPLGAHSATAVVLVYEVATIATMVALVLPARAGAKALRFSWLERWADTAAGAVIVGVGVGVAILGW